MQQEILLWCVAAPAIVALVTATLVAAGGRFAANRAGWSAAQAALATTGWSAAVAIALVGRQSPLWWPEDAWQRVMWPVAIVSIGMALCIRDAASDWRWLVAGVGAMATAAVAMPHGEGWVDLFGLHRDWTFAVAASGLITVWMLDTLARRGAERWVLWIALAGLGGPIMLAASTYAGLAEWVLAAIVATAVMALAATLVRSPPMWTVLYGSTLFASAATAAARFYTYEEHPAWLYVLVLLLPVIVAGADLSIRNRSAPLRVAAAFVVALVLLAVIAWNLFG